MLQPVPHELPSTIAPLVKPRKTSRGWDTSSFARTLKGPDASARRTATQVYAVLVARVRAEVAASAEATTLATEVLPLPSDSGMLLVEYVKMLQELLRPVLEEGKVPNRANLVLLAAVTAMLHHVHDPKLADLLLPVLSSVLKAQLAVCSLDAFAEGCDAVMRRDTDLFVQLVRCMRSRFSSQRVITFV